MRASYKWLCELAGFTPDPAELMEKLTFAGLEVDSMQHRGPEFNNIVVGQIVTKDAHPKRDKLSLVEVDTGGGVVNVVCGAPNCPGPGAKVVLAMVGAKFGDFEIAPRELAGAPSEGMLCSTDELDIGPESDGILILDTDANPGTPIAQALGLEDWIYEIEVTPNRPDALYHRGLAREMCMLYDKPFAPSAPVAAPLGGNAVAEAVTIEIADADACWRYAGAVVKGVEVKPSPFALQYRLHNVGIRPISNVVDITNAILMEHGQPLHAFDLGKLAGDKIIVRKASAGEKMTTLDEVERKLTTEDLLICDGEKPVALAGVMGGLESEVAADTRDILIECACFNPSTIRRTAKTQKLSSESSYRFERGVDPNHAEEVLDATVAMVCSLAGGTQLPGILDVHPSPVTPVRVTFRPARYERIMGQAVDKIVAEKVLRGIGAAVTADGENFMVDIPTFRPDMEREIDLIEEVARVSGMNKIEPVLPKIQCQVPMREEFDNSRKAREVLASLGLQDAITYSFVPGPLLTALRMDDSTIKIANPLNAERDTLRTTLLAGLLENLRRARSRYMHSFAQFEVARTYHAVEGAELPKEVLRVAAILSGTRPEWVGAQNPWDVYDAKGIVAQLCEALTDQKAEFTPDTLPHLHPRRTLAVDCAGERIGHLGELHPRSLSEMKLDRGVICFELDLLALCALKKRPSAQALSEFPPMTRDVALVAPLEMDATILQGALKEACGKLATDVQLFDVYTGKHMDAEKKSLAFSVQYRSVEKTLTDKEVDAVHNSAVARICKEFGVSMR